MVFFLVLKNFFEIMERNESAKRHYNKIKQNFSETVKPNILHNMGVSHAIPVFFGTTIK